MLQLIWVHREISQLPYVKGDSVEFSNEARLTLNREFHAVNTDLHWLALFLHPLCRKLAICSAVHSRKLTDAIAISLKITEQWKWSKGQAIKLVADLKKYFAGHAPFSGGKSNAREWWSCLIADSFDHPLKTLAICIHKIVPHAADVERLFSSLDGVQGTKRCRLTVSHMETLGILRNEYARQLHENALKLGKATHRKHAHMHTLNTPGINAEHVATLTDKWTWVPPLTATNNTEELQGFESITLEELDAAFDRLLQQTADTAGGDGLGDKVSVDQVYDFHEVEKVRKGFVPPSKEEETVIHSEKGTGVEKWDPKSLMLSLGL
jgi:hypothetical protein